ncbi:MAG: hypothetical protein JSW10_07955 [Pseudomonadota bacterium]|nr:MAG: hypothetical protein JSW10_07955 [Pseudomonadota bacterium]
MLRKVALATLCVAAFLAGCAAPPDKPEREGFEPDGGEATGKESIRPGTDTGPAVLALLDEARGAAKAGNLNTAQLQLERALRIEPDNPVLWHYMAKLRLHESRWKEARSLAAKSNTLAGADKRLQADNWRIIAHARQGMGDERGARDAQATARALQPQ